MTPRDWENGGRARELLAELDAVERQSDWCTGKGWTDAARAHAERAREIESELDDLRNAAIEAFADSVSPDRRSDEWLDAEIEAGSEAETVERAAQSARRQHLGDQLLFGAAA